jgi:hypothetical protein
VNPLRKGFSFYLLCVAFLLLPAMSFASRPARDLPSSQNGFSDQGNCDNPSGFTPFVAGLDGETIGVGGDNPPTPCVYTNSGAGTYPNYSLSLAAQDKSFSVTITPYLWGNQTLLNVGFVPNSNLNIAFSSFVIAGLQVTTSGSGSSSTTSALTDPLFVFCELNSNQDFYTLMDTVSTPSVTLCMPSENSFQTVGDTNSYSGTLVPTPIAFADQNTTRWDINTFQQPPFPTILSADLAIDGLPSDLVAAGVTDTTPPATNNLTQQFMSSAANFLVIAVETMSDGTQVIHTAGGLVLNTPPFDALSGVVPPAPVNDEIENAIVIDPVVAVSSNGFSQIENTSAATPLQVGTLTAGSSSYLTDVPSPNDPTLPSCVNSTYTNNAIFRTVWFSFLPTRSGTVNISTAKSRYDTVMAVFTGAPGNLTPVPNGCHDDNGNQLQAALHGIPVTKGTQYYIMVG